MGEEITFGGWLKQRRKEMGITQEEFAENIGCALATLQKIEGGARRPSGQIAHLLADLLNIPGDERGAFVVFARSDRALPATVSGASLAPDVAPVDAQAASKGFGIMHVPWRAMSLNHTNLPVVLTALLGREQEEEEAHNHLLNPKTRLLSLTGAPGVGKTRLALQVAWELVEHFEDGVYFVDLASVVDPDLVLPTVARTLGLKDAGDLPVENVLLEYMGERRMLLVLDNFEQVLDAANALVKLMYASPWLKVLVTSREALRVRGERRLSIPPLAVPEPSFFSELAFNAASGHASSRPSLMEALASYPSVKLFVERAQDVSPDFELTPENAGDVAILCVGLQGLPLAIELAAARANHLSSHEMRTALDNSLRLLRGGMRDLPVRHRTLEAAIGWSYDLLDTVEQMLFRRLGVFVGGGTLAAMQAMCEVGDAIGDGDDERSSMPTSDIMLALVDKNLIRRQGLDLSVVNSRSEEVIAGKAGGVRFGMLEAIREYALERLVASGEATPVRQRHARYFLTLAESGSAHPEGKDQKQWLDQLESDYPNIREAMFFLLEAVESSTDEYALELALRLGTAMSTFWYIRGHADEGRGWLKQVLDMQSSMAATFNNAAVENNGTGTRLPTPSIPPQLRRAALSVLGQLSWFQSDFKQASAAYRECLSIGKQLGDRPAVARALNNLGMIATGEGDPVAAADFYQESLSIARELGEVVGITRLLNNLGVLAHKRGDYTDARRYYSESLEIRRGLGENQALPMVLNNLGIIATDLGDFAEAVRLHQEALQIADAAGDKGNISMALLGLGDAALKQGNYPTSYSLYKESLQIGYEVSRKITVTEAVEGLAKLAAVLNEPLSAARLCGIADMMRATLHAPMNAANEAQFSNYLTDARRVLGKEAWQVAWDEGHAVPWEDVARYALALPIQPVSP